MQRCSEYFNSLSYTYYNCFASLNVKIFYLVLQFISTLSRMLKHVVAVLCLLLVGEAMAGKLNITPEQKRKMDKGIEAGKKLTQLLQSGSFDTAMANVDTYVVSWMDGVELVFDFVGSFFPETNELILEEIIRGFKQVNARLDIVIGELGEIKRLIQWKDMEVRFADIESKIRLLDNTLKDTLRSPNRKDGVNRFNSIFNSQYQSSGFYLYDAVAKNDQVFSKNLLAAAMKFSDNTRKQTQKFSKGLIGLILKAVNVELAAEKFARQNTGQKFIWKDRVSECRRAMQAADKALELEGWKLQSKTDADGLGYARKDNNNHQEMANAIYDKLAQKFYWRYWFVMAYDKVEGLSKHAQALPNHAHTSFGKFNRNYIVVSTDPKNPWSLAAAKASIKPVTCRALPHLCHRDTGKWIIDGTPRYGQAKMVVQKGTSVYYKGQNGRFAYGISDLLRPTGGWYDSYHIVYFG